MCILLENQPPQSTTQMSQLAAHSSERFLPQAWKEALLLGRLDLGHGPTPVLVRNGIIHDLSNAAPTVSEWVNRYEPGQEPERLRDRRTR